MPKVLNQVLDYSDLYIFQDPDTFCFSLDSVLLAKFVEKKQKKQKICDLGTGNAIIPLLISRDNFEISGLEIQEYLYELACDSVKYNNLNGSISLFKGDIKDAINIFGPNKFDAVVCNPPFFKVGEQSQVNLSMFKVIARHEMAIKLSDIIMVASKILKDKGIFYTVIRPDRFHEICELFEKNSFSIKKIKPVYPKRNSVAKHILISATKNGKNHTCFDVPLVVHNKDGSYTEDVKKMFKWEE